MIDPHFNHREQTNIPCPECNCKLDRVEPSAFIIEPYYICPKCTALFFEDNPVILKEIQTEDTSEVN